MATDLEKLVVQLSADIKGYERDMRKAVGITNRQAREVESRFRQMNRNLDGMGRGAAKSLIAPFAGIAAALGGRELIRMTGEWTDLTSRVNLAAGSMEKGEQVMGRISDMARRTYSDLSQTAEGYMAFSTTLTELGVSTDKQLDFVESLNNALVVSGAKGQTAATVTEALSKAMALGSLSGQNLNTVVSQGGRVAQALAESMGVTTAELRKLGQEGKIGRRELLGITKEMEKLRYEAGEMPGTIQDGFLLLNNALLEYVGRGDDAVGMSRMIADALTLIADNFETVADAGLKLAAILAAGMLGRSIGGMVANMGAAIPVILRFGAALKAATSLASVGTAISGLSSVAGPLGMIMGGMLAGGVLLYTDRAREATGRSEQLRSELHKMGLYSSETVVALEDISSAVDGIGSEKQLEQIRKLKEGIVALKGNDSFAAMIFGDVSEIGTIISEANKEIGRGFFSSLSTADRAVAVTIRDIAKQLQAGTLEASEFNSAMGKLPISQMGEKTRKWAQDLLDVGAALFAAKDGLAALGASPDIDAATQSLSGLRGELEVLAQNGGLLSPLQQAIADLIIDFESGQRSAEETKAILVSLGGANPDFGPFISRVMEAISVLDALRAAAQAAKAALPGVEGSEGGDTSSQLQGQKSATFKAEQDRLNSLSRYEQDIEKRMERLSKRTADFGAVFTQDQIRQMAIEEAAADARRSEEAKSARGSGSKKKKKDEPGLFADAEKQLQNIEREITLIGKSTAEVAKARAEWAMLDEAKKRGIPVNDQLNKQIDEAAGKIGKLAAEQERLTNISEGVNSALRGAFDGIFDDPKQALKDLAKQLAMMALQMQLVKSFPAAFGAGGIIPLGFAAGGYTGSGGKFEPAGVVHRGEYVMDAETVRRMGGPAAFDAMRGQIKRGYANGGYVGPSIPSAAARGAGQGGGTSFQIIDQRGKDAPAIETQKQRGPNGREMVTMIVREEWARGGFDNSMRGRQGINPQKVMR